MRAGISGETEKEKIMLYTESKLIDLGLSDNDIRCLHTLANRYLNISSRAAIHIKIKDLITLAAHPTVTNIWVQLFSSLSEEATSLIICSEDNDIMNLIELDNLVDIFEISGHVIITLRE